MFFVVDFETSALDPWHGEPLSLGIVPVTQYGEILAEQFYTNRWNIEALIPEWQFPANLTETESWWNQKRLSEDLNDAAAFREAWVRVGPTRSDEQILDDISDYLYAVEPDKNQRFMVANPIAFDKMWMEYIHAMFGREMPFHYRCLCLRSMRYGLEYGDNPEFGNSRDEHELDGYIPHHALWDARMEALDLVHLMKKSNEQCAAKFVNDVRLARAEQIGTD